ncbi:MAG: hypothetical protein ACHQ51_07305 [Elusimicrobiota bacterium]
MSQKSVRAFSILIGAAFALSPAFAAGPAAPPSPAAPAVGEFTPSQQATVDAAIARARALTEEMESLAAGGADGSNCPKGVTVKEISEDYKANRFSKGINGEIRRLVGKDSDGWEMANACSAYASKNPAQCSSMLASDYDEDPKDLPDHPLDFMRGRCGAFAKILPVYRAYDAKDPAFVEACVGLAPSFDGLTSPDALRKACQALADYKGDPEPFIAAYSAAVNPTPSRTEAMDNLQKLTGDQKLCDKYIYSVQREVCKERGSFQRASASKSKGACRGALCRVMMGEPAGACETYAADVKKAICRVAYLPAYVDDQTRAFQGLSDQVVAAVSNAGLTDLAALKEVNQRLDHVFALRARFDDAANKIAPKAPPANAAAHK